MSVDATLIMPCANPAILRLLFEPLEPMQIKYNHSAALIALGHNFPADAQMCEEYASWLGPSLLRLSTAGAEFDSRGLLCVSDSTPVQSRCYADLVGEHARGGVWIALPDVRTRAMVATPSGSTASTKFAKWGILVGADAPAAGLKKWVFTDEIYTLADRRFLVVATASDSVAALCQDAFSGGASAAKRWGSETPRAFPAEWLDVLREKRAENADAILATVGDQICPLFSPVVSDSRLTPWRILRRPTRKK